MTQSIHVQNQSLSEPVLNHSTETAYRLLHILFSVVPIAAQSQPCPRVGRIAGITCGGPYRRSKTHRCMTTTF